MLRRSPRDRMEGRPQAASRLARFRRIPGRPDKLRTQRNSSRSLAPECCALRDAKILFCSLGKKSLASSEEILDFRASCSIHAGLRVFFFVSGRGSKSLRNSHCARVPENDLSSEMKVTSRMVTSALVFLCCQWLLMRVMGRVMAANTEAAIGQNGGLQMPALPSFEVTQATS